MSQTNPASARPGWPFRLLVVALVASIIALVAVGAFRLVFERYGSVSDDLMTTSICVAICFAALLSAATAARRRPFLRLSMAISMVLTSCGTAMLVLLLWFEPWSHHSYLSHVDAELVSKIAGSCLTLGIALAHNGAFSLIRSKSRILLGLKVSVMVGVWLIVGFIFMMAWMEHVFSSNGGFGFYMWYFLLMGLAVLTLLGTIAVPIAAISRANKETAPVESLGSKLALLLECPKCAKRQELRTGNVRCGKCGTGLFIEIEEPRCECGYLLYQLQGDTCPECGRPIPAANRWPALGNA